ncbi:unnamed protein product [Caenorhabditis nigoni]
MERYQFTTDIAKITLLKQHLNPHLKAEFVRREDSHAPQPFHQLLRPEGEFPVERQHYDFADQGHLAPRFCYNEPEPMALAPDAPLNGFGIGPGGEEIMNEFFYPQHDYAPQNRQHFSSQGSNLTEVRQNAHEAIYVHCE